MGYVDKDRQNSYQNTWMQERRFAWILSAGGKCVLCLSTENLEVDHIDRNLKTMNPRQIWSLSDANPKKIAELENCQVLCNSCHKDKTRQEKMKNFEHGDFGMYSNRGCRCQPCKDANAARVRAERAAKKLKLNIE